MGYQIRSAAISERVRLVSQGVRENERAKRIYLSALPSAAVVVVAACLFVCFNRDGIKLPLPLIMYCCCCLSVCLSVNVDVDVLSAALLLGDVVGAQAPR